MTYGCYSFDNNVMRCIFTSKYVLLCFIHCFLFEPIEVLNFRHKLIALSG